MSYPLDPPMQFVQPTQRVIERGIFINLLDKKLVYFIHSRNRQIALWLARSCMRNTDES